MIGTVPWPLAIGLLLTTCGAAPLGYSARVLFSRAPVQPADVRGLRVAVAVMLGLFFAGLALRGTFLLG